MKKPNAYLQKRESEKQTFLDVGEQFGMQKMWDYVQIALHDPEVMGRDTFGENRLCKLFDAFSAKNVSVILHRWLPAIFGRNAATTKRLLRR